MCTYLVSQGPEYVNPYRIPLSQRGGLGIRMVVSGPITTSLVSWYASQAFWLCVVYLLPDRPLPQFTILEEVRHRSQGPGVQVAQLEPSHFILVGSNSNQVTAVVLRNGFFNKSTESLVPGVALDFAIPIEDDINIVVIVEKTVKRLQRVDSGPSRTSSTNDLLLYNVSPSLEFIPRCDPYKMGSVLVDRKEDSATMMTRRTFLQLAKLLADQIMEGRVFLNAVLATVDSILAAWTDESPNRVAVVAEDLLIRLNVIKLDAFEIKNLVEWDIGFAIDVGKGGQGGTGLRGGRVETHGAWLKRRAKQKRGLPGVFVFTPDASYAILDLV
jgi:hypothetical protein